MTQDGQFSAEATPFAAAERVSATLGSLTDALFDARASRHPAAVLTQLRSTAHPAAEALFQLPLAPNGPVHTAVGRLGTVVTAGTARPGSGAALAPLAIGGLLARYGATGPVRGAAGGSPEGLTAGHFDLPVTGEPADPKLRPAFAAPLAALAAGQQTRQPVELPTGAGAEVRLVVPPGFHALTAPGGPPGVSARTVSTGSVDGIPAGRGIAPATGAAAAELTAHLAETAEELFSGTAPADRREFALIAAALADVVTASGAVYAGVAAVQVDGRAADATLVVSLARHPLPITGLATELATVRRHAEVWTVLLPAGPAAVLVEGRSVPVPGPLAADGVRRWAVTSVVEAFVPLPDGASVLCVQLTTAQPQDWELYTGVFAELLKSVQFGWDGVPAAPAAPLPAVPPPAATVLLVPAAEPAPAAAHPVAQHPAPVAAPPLPAAAPAAPTAPPVTDRPVADLPRVAAAAGDEAAELPVHLRGTPVRVPPADFNPFAPVADPTPAQPILIPEDAPAAPAAPKGTPVMVPPPDFDPFGILGTPAAAPPAETPAEAPEPLKGTPVMVPPPDFDPFGILGTPAATPATAPPAAAPRPAATAADPFGTVTAAERAADPFGTTVPGPQSVPPPPTAPPSVPAPERDPFG
ncbi:hypothetical protein [Kitasatospora purpeofusca]|uniref:hypothetical protein n=1 Tax=Kitasatospora purpeofusca TaxID=67352 RepID=UPI0038667726|nr:hypothetical protein OIP63_06805 [Kitasatospora purpeofusca]